MKTKKRMPSPNSVMSGLRKTFLGILLLLISSTQINAQCPTLPGSVTLPVGTVNWNLSVSRVKNVVVPNGCTLNITAIQYMSPGITITINTGGIVNLNSGGVLQACNVSWGGFRVKGNAALSQAGSNQGKLNINGTGTIKHATLAVDVDGGGIITTNGGIFTDNKEAVSMDPYSIATPPNVTNNLSKFYGTTFVWTVLFPGTTSFTQHVKIKQVYNIHFGGCTFNNTYGNASTNPTIRGKGLVSIEASFFCHRQNPTIINGCNVYNETKTKFTNLLAGIDGRTVTPNNLIRSSRIWQCEFLNNDHDIFIDKEPEYKIDQNSFTYYQPNALFFAGQTSFIKINQLLTGTYPTTGINYSIYRNEFNGYNSVILDFLLINNTYNGLSVFKNTFTNSFPTNSGLAYGVKAQGNNIGASFTCNTYSGFYDRLLFFTGTNPVSFGSPTQTAANVFPPCSSINTAILFILGTTSTYYYGPQPGQNPTGCNIGAFTLVSLPNLAQQNPCFDYTCTAPPRFAANDAPRSVEITAFPNPASQNITFSANEDVVYRSLTVFDVSGKIVLEKAPDSEQTMIVDISALQKGIYFYEIITIDEERITGKFIKE